MKRGKPQQPRKQTKVLQMRFFIDKKYAIYLHKPKQEKIK
jgi:hypothetical protein